MIYSDLRGKLHSIKSIPFVPKETLISVSEKNVFRGLHKSPYAKYIYVMEGHICDVFIDFVTNQYNQVDVKMGEFLYIPEKQAHGFYAYEKSTVIYFLEDHYDAQYDQKIHYLTPEISAMGLKYDFPTDNLIISKEDLEAKYYRQYKYLILGSSGYLGSYLTKYIHDYLAIDNRLCDLDGIKRHIIKSGCQYVICAAGISGRPTIEWCETHERETFEVNYLDILALMKLCDECNVHLTIFGSGLVYKNHQDIYTEDDVPDLTTKVYTKYRVALEEIIRDNIYPNVLYLRILYPCTFDDHPKCFFSKMRHRAFVGCVHNVDVPLTIVPDLFPMIPKILDANTTGVLNFVNEGTIKLPRLLSMKNIECKEIREPDESSMGSGYALCSKKLRGIIGHLKTVEDAIAIDYSNI